MYDCMGSSVVKNNIQTCKDTFKPSSLKDLTVYQILSMHTPYQGNPLPPSACGQHCMSYSILYVLCAWVQTLLYQLGQNLCCTIRSQRLHHLDTWVGLFDTGFTIWYGLSFSYMLLLNKGIPLCQHAPVMSLGKPLSYSSQGCSLLSNTQALLNHWLLCSFADK